VLTADPVSDQNEPPKTRQGFSLIHTAASILLPSVASAFESCFAHNIVALGSSQKWKRLMCPAKPNLTTGDRLSPNGATESRVGLAL
jgi:hypothetical protein